MRTYFASLGKVLIDYVTPIAVHLFPPDHLYAARRGFARGFRRRGGLGFVSRSRLTLERICPELGFAW